MKIIFSPTKDMNLKNPKSSEVQISEKTRQLMDILQNLSFNEVKDTFKLSDKKAKEVKEYFENFQKDESYTAIELYKGLSFRNLDVDNLDDTAKEFLNERLLILSALYGPIAPDKMIYPYRLDFNTSLKDLGQSLKSYWTDEYKDSIEDNELVINLASNEFSSLFDSEKYDWYDFDFYEYKDGKLKSHSTTSKKGRGWLLSHIAKNQINDIDYLRLIKDEYEYDSDKSTKNLLVFIKK